MARKDGREVLLVKQKGSKRGDDDKVKRTAQCKGAVSDTVRAVRNR